MLAIHGFTLALLHELNILSCTCSISTRMRNPSANIILASLTLNACFLIVSSMRGFQENTTSTFILCQRAVGSSIVRHSTSLQHFAGKAVAGSTALAGEILYLRPPSVAGAPGLLHLSCCLFPCILLVLTVLDPNFALQFRIERQSIRV